MTIYNREGKVVSMKDGMPKLLFNDKDGMFLVRTTIASYGSWLRVTDDLWLQPDRMAVSYPWTASKGMGVTTEDYSTCCDLFAQPWMMHIPFPFTHKQMPDGTNGVVFLTNGWTCEQDVG